MDNTFGTAKNDDRVNTGQSVVLDWKLTADFAPKDGDPNCVPFAYHSHNNADAEMISGLLGLLVVCREGQYIFCLTHFSLLTPKSVIG